MIALVNKVNKLMNKIKLNFFDPLFNSNLKNQLINVIYSKKTSLNRSAHLAHELYFYLKNNKILENEFFILPESSEFTRYFCKYFISCHLQLMKEKLKAEDEDLTAIYSEFYFKNILLGPLYEEVLYKNLYYEDFRSFFEYEFKGIMNIVYDNFLETHHFSQFLNQKLDNYIQSHLGYFKTLSKNQIITEPVNYGLFMKLDI